MSNRASYGESNDTLEKGQQKVVGYKSVKFQHEAEKMFRGQTGC